MRCVKCGYISFDHLSECNKCKTDLTVARDGFGFLAGKPAVPFLLGSLIRDYEPPAQQDNIVAETAETETSTSFDFAAFEGVSEGFLNEDPGTGEAETVAAIEGPDESEEDFSLLDLSDEELELLIDNESPGGSEMKAILPESVTHGADNHPSEPLSAAEPAPWAHEIPRIEAETASTAASEPDELILTLDDFPLEFDSEPKIAPTLELVPKSGVDPIELESESKASPPFDWVTESSGDQTESGIRSEITPASELGTGFINNPMESESEDRTTPAFDLLPKFHDEPMELDQGPEAPSEVKPGAQQAQPKPGDLTDDFVIELSENDLDALIEELSSTPKGAGELEAGSGKQKTGPKARSSK